MIMVVMWILRMMITIIVNHLPKTIVTAEFIKLLALKIFKR